ncbi:MAG TPA: hypothetical protein VIU61_19455 [Kofleriaceae bacterium]
MTRFGLVLLALAGCQVPDDVALGSETSASQSEDCEWTQWGRSAAHDSRSCARAQPLDTLLAHRTLDPLVVEDEDPYRGSFAHIQVPLSDNDGNVFVMSKSGIYGEPSTYVWYEKGLHWEHGELVERWSFTSDWRPSPLARPDGALFQAALSGRWIWVPGAGGTLHKIEKGTGQVRERVNPFGNAIDPDTYIHGGITADGDGNIFYNAVKFAATNPRTSDIQGAWLVRISPRGDVRLVDYRTLVPGAPAPTDPCYLTFAAIQPRPPGPWPPVTPELPPQAACLSQRPPLETTPAVGADGTIYVLSRAHANDRYSYMVALRPDLELRWATSMRDLLDDGCGELAFCRPGATPGVDPETNLLPAPQASDAPSSAPLPLPDGGVAFGAVTSYNGGRGHLMKFDRDGAFAGSFDFGWDMTPGLWEHDGTYSLIVKDNYYNEGIYYVTQINADLEEEWEFEATNTFSCERLPDGTIECEDFGWPFEWCIASPGIDRDGTVYVGSADGNLYGIAQGGVEHARYFMDRTVFAAYTPTAIDGRGRVQAMNNGQLFVVGR